MAAPPRDPITCHVLDTTTGRPAPSINVKLTCLSIPDIIFCASTNADGRVTTWSSTQGPSGSEGAFVQERGGVPATLNYMIRHYGAEGATGLPAGKSTWKLNFDTGSYYGLEHTFFPMVELSFLVKEGEHFHVPLLLGPYSFTTYRGS